MPGAAPTKGRPLARLGGATALALLAGLGFPGHQAGAQAPDLVAPQISDDAQMLLEADRVIYDNDRQTVTAVGGVQIDYDGNRLVAERVTYDRASGRLIAAGNVEILDSSGTRIFSDEIDVTDDFSEGFLNALRVEAPDDTYFAAESAQREPGEITTFNRGVYTACEPCEERPERPPIWQVKARTIIWNGRARTVRFEHARFELFGLPIAYAPFFEVPDPTVKRKSGFLFPSASYKEELGFGFSIPYYFALSPTFDLTVTPTYYTKQGFLGQAEWRQRFDSGQYNLRIAGISQRQPEAFLRDGETQIDPLRSASDALVKGRLMVGSTGAFTINPRWSFGWNVMAQTDPNFAHTYRLAGHSEYIHRSQAYLTGLNDRNFFDLRAYRFQVQEPIPSDRANANSPRQPWVLPSFDYAYTPDEPVAGGELNIDVNVTAISRGRLATDRYAAFPGIVPPIEGRNIRGVEGSTARVTAEAEWRRSFTTSGGLVITPLLHARTDAIQANLDDATVAVIEAQDVASDIRSQYYRYMATAGLELRWPVLFSSTSSTHVLEPMAQVFARPDEIYARTIGIPNEDAQSFVFDAASLFERDKFSGYDRIEGGTRANLGIRYSGTFASGWTTNALFGQSFHLAGLNSFAAPDLVNAGAFSGLETDRSDFVGMVGLSSPGGFSVSAGGRFDDESFEARRGELKAAYTTAPVTLTTQYAYIQAQPLYGFPDDRHEVTVGANAKVQEFWSVFGSATYDFGSEKILRDSIGFQYDDECFTFALSLSQSRNPFNNDVQRTVGFRVAFRTLGDFGSAQALAAN